MSAQEALSFNMVSKIFTRNELDTILWPQLIQQAQLPIESLRVTKSLMQRFVADDLLRACDHELTELYKRFESNDFIEALMSFLQRKSKL